MKVSVLVAACEHEDHVGEALDSVRMQRMTFELEVLVGVTADGPGSKAASFFGGGDFEVLGVPVQEAEGPRLRRLLERATGEYVARLHTCDFWLREDKLKLQVEALEARPAAHVCVHDTILFYDDGSRPATELRYESLFGPYGLLSVREPLDPSSVVMRRRPASAYPAWVWQLSYVDGALHLIDGLGAIAHVAVRGGASRVRQSALTCEGRIRRLKDRLVLLEHVRPCVASRYLEQVEYASSNIRMLLAVERAVPPGAAVLVLSSGDEELVELGDRKACHFPADVTGYAGGLPADGREAATLLERGREEGASYLVVPAGGRWWLEEYTELAEYLDASHERVRVDADAVLYRLRREHA